MVLTVDQVTVESATSQLRVRCCITDSLDYCNLHTGWAKKPDCF